MLAEMMCLRAKLYCMFKGRIMKGTDKQKRKNGTEACIWVFAHALLVRSFIELREWEGVGGVFPTYASTRSVRITSATVRYCRRSIFSSLLY